MLLCIDIGNTNIVMGLWSNKEWLARWRVRTVRDKMPDEYRILLKALFNESGYDLKIVNRVVISSVVPQLKTGFLELFKNYLGIKPLILGPGIKTGLPIRTDNPIELGADLVANAVGAYNKLNTACIIVDFGTATTFSAVSERGEFMGVAIAPGLEVASDALSYKTAQLPRISLIPPSKVIGTNTIHSMQSGLVFGYIGLVEGLICRILRELGGNVKVIATGGLSKTIAPLTDKIDLFDTDLTIEGLRIIADKNYE